MSIIKGKIGNIGIGVGKIRFINNSFIPSKTSINDVDAEIAKFNTAIKKVSESYEKRIADVKNNVDDKALGIIEAKELLLKDKAFIDVVNKYINDEKANVAYAVYECSEKLANDFLNSDNEYLKGRSLDIKDIGSKIISALNGKDAETLTINEETIIYADDISPEDIVSFDKTYVKGIITKKGFALSHTSILAGTYEIPYLFGIDEVKAKDGDNVILDCIEGNLILSPDEKTISDYKKRIEEIKNEVVDNDEKFKIKLYANIGGVNDLDLVIKNDAEGIGLFRTEFLFMNRDVLPTEEEQYKVYKEVAEKMEGKEVIIRTLDIGADKKTNCIRLSDEENPALGLRAIRFCFKNEDILKTQLRAILRATYYGNIKIMFPMIASVWEVEKAKKILDEVKNELEKSKIGYKMPKVGIMIEVPSAAVCSDVLAKNVDFFSIGTNDLTQYTLATDRCNEEMSEYFDIKHEAVFRLIEMVTKNAHANNIPVGICGELGGVPDATKKLAKIGVDELSMSSSKLKNVRKVLHEYYQNNGSEVLYAPADGTIIPMNEIPDEAFSSGVLGKCIGVDPKTGFIYAPCDGEVTMVADTKHFINIKTKKGREIFIHAGIDTVSLKGEGFDVKVKAGDKIKKGDIILEMDIDKVRKKKLSPIVILGYEKNQ